MTGLSPSEYKKLTLTEVNAFIETVKELNRGR